MKVDDKGGIKLARNEKRIGKSNFFLKDEGTHMKIFDISQVATHRTLKDTPLGSYLHLCYQQMSDDIVCRSLQNYVAVLWTVCCVVPDGDFMTDVYNASEACLKRHPEVYGELPGDVSDEEDAEIIAEGRDLQEFGEKLSRIPGDVGE